MYRLALGEEVRPDLTGRLGRREPLGRGGVVRGAIGDGGAMGGGADVDGEALAEVGGVIGKVAAQANAPPVQPPQDQSNSIPVVAEADLARRHAIARAYALGLPIPEMVEESAE